MKIIDIVEKINTIDNIELYLIVFLIFFTLWFMLNTVKYYKGEKRKVKHLHRFAKEGEPLSQYELAKRYEKGQAVKKSCQNAAFWYQKASHAGNGEAGSILGKMLKRKHC
jgi:TPR repeat protein